jgi:hypothetical protein
LTAGDFRAAKATETGRHSRQFRVVGQLALMQSTVISGGKYFEEMM